MSVELVLGQQGCNVIQSMVEGRVGMARIQRDWRVCNGQAATAVLLCIGCVSSYKKKLHMHTCVFLCVCVCACVRACLSV